MEMHCENGAVYAGKKKQSVYLSGKKKKFVIGGIIVAVIAVAAVVIAIVADIENGYKKPVESMASAIEEADLEMFFGSIADERVIQLKGEDLLKLYFRALFDYIEYECGRDYNVSVEYGNKEKFSKDKIEEAVENCREKGVVYDAGKMKYLHKVGVTMTAQGDGGEVKVFDGEVFVAKYKGEWKIIDLGLEFECEEQLKDFIYENVDRYIEDFSEYY